MKTPILIFLIIATGIISGAELLVILTTVPPATASQGVLWTLFITLFLASTAVFSLLWHGIKAGIIYRSFTPSLWSSLRQAGIVALLAVLTLFFNSLGVLSIWDILPLSVSAVLIEFFFQAEKSPLAARPHEPA